MTNYKSPFKARWLTRMKWALADYNRGISGADICRKYDISTTTLTIWRRRLGIPAHKKKNSKKDLPPTRHKKCLGCPRYFDAKIQRNGMYGDYHSSGCAARSTGWTSK